MCPLGRGPVGPYARNRSITLAAQGFLEGVRVLCSAASGGRLPPCAALVGRLAKDQFERGGGAVDWSPHAAFVYSQLLRVLDVPVDGTTNQSYNNLRTALGACAL